MQRRNGAGHRLCYVVHALLPQAFRGPSLLPHVSRPALSTQEVSFPELGSYSSGHEVPSDYSSDVLLTTTPLCLTALGVY